MLQDNLKGLKVIILDEKSLIGLRLLYILVTRLRQIFGKPTVSYGGISIILMGDFQQPAPVLLYYMYSIGSILSIKFLGFFGSLVCYSRPVNDK